MIGKNQIQLGADQFISGMSSSDYATDGALGVLSTGLNPFIKPGAIAPMAAPTDLSTNVLGNIIASAEDSQSVSAYARTFIDNAGNYYTYDAPATVTKRNTATTNAASYTAFQTDMVSFALNTYVTTSNGDIDLWNTSTLTLTNSWWIGTKSQTAMTTGVPHPMLVYQGNLYVADKNKLNTIDGGATIALAVLTLNANEIIYAMGIDPVTGLIMLSVQTTVNASDGISSRFFVYLYDGISAKATRKIPVDDLVTAFHNVEGVVYVGQGAALGYWNGNGITFLRKLQFASLVSTDLIYKHRMTNTRSILQVVDGPNVLSYGAVVSGKKGFFYTAFNPSGTGHIQAIFPLGFNQLAVAYATNKLTKFDYLDTNINSFSTMYFNNIYFPRPIMIHRMRVLTTGIPHTGNTDIAINILDEKGAVLPIDNAHRILSVPTGTTYVLDFDYGGAKCQSIQPLLAISNNNYAITRVIIYYDVAE